MKFIRNKAAESWVTVRLPEGNYEAHAILGDFAPRETAVEITMRAGHEIPVGPKPEQRIQSYFVVAASFSDAMRELVQKVADRRRENGFMPKLALS